MPISGSYYYCGTTYTTNGGIKANNITGITISSSNGQVVIGGNTTISGNLAVTGTLSNKGYSSATLPDAQTVVSGSITFVNDLGFLAIAWNGTWQKISTGSF